MVDRLIPDEILLAEDRIDDDRARRARILLLSTGCGVAMSVTDFARERAMRQENAARKRADESLRVKETTQRALLDSRAVFAAAVRLGTRLLDDYVHYAELTVSDNGTGIKNVDRSEVFDPFYTTRLEDGGSGLGLSVVHGVIGDHGGKIEIEQPIEGGTRFRIILPLARPAVQA